MGKMSTGPPATPVSPDKFVFSEEFFQQAITGCSTTLAPHCARSTRCEHATAFECRRANVWALCFAGTELGALDQNQAQARLFLPRPMCPDPPLHGIHRVWDASASVV